MKKLLTALLISAACVCWCVAGWNVISPGHDKSWVEMDGVVLSADVENRHIDNTNNGGQGDTYYDARITYSYILNGATHTGSEMVGVAQKNNPAKTQATADAYRPGMIVSIWYNPSDPGKSVLDSGASDRVRSCIFLGVVLTATAIGIRLFNVKNTPVQSVKPSKNEIPEASPAPAPKPRPAEPVHAPPAAETVISGTWILEYQIPSLREIIASGQAQQKQTSHHDRNAVMGSGLDALTVTATGNEIVFSYKDSSGKGGCDIVGSFTLTGKRMDMELKSMDFIIAEIDGFPPVSYTYSRKGTNLTLTSDTIKGLGDRPITYHFAALKTT